MNIEEGAFASSIVIGYRLGVDDVEVIGRLAKLWHASQACEATEGAQDDINVWLGVGPGNTDWCRELARAGILEDLGDRFRIIGNGKHIDNLRQRREAASVGGRRSARRRRSQENEAHASSERFNRVLEPRTEQNRTEQSKSPPTPPGELGECVKKATVVWLETLHVFGVQRNRLRPPEDSQLASAIQRHGLQEVVLALEGARHEPRTQSFNPADRPSLTRVLGPKMFGTLADVGRKARDGTMGKGEVWDQVFGGDGDDARGVQKGNQSASSRVSGGVRDGPPPDAVGRGPGP